VISYRPKSPLDGLAALLPKLAQPFWYRQAHSGIWTSEKENKAAMSPDALRVYNRKRTKAARKATQALGRARALALLAA
jgi:hypothetical protein